MVTPGEEIRRRLQDRGWTQGDLAQIMDRPPQTVNQIIQGKKAITPDMAAALAAAFGTTPDLWMQLESQFRLSLVKVDTSPIEKRARLCDYAPVKEMIRRGWIAAAESVEEQERIVCQFFEIGSLDEVPRIVAAMRKSSPSTDLSPSQTAWCFRARHVAKSLPIGGFDEKRMGAMKRDLRILAAYPAEAQRIPTIMRENGIRFVVVEHLAGSKVDGAAFWLDEQSPTIAVSLRLDRMDNFWFTLMHECAHIDHHDAISIDAEMGHEEREQPLMKETAEKRADEDAAAALIPPDELDSFIRRIGPIYAKPNIIQFAHRIKMHPGIILGQLQYRAEIKFGAHHEMQPKIRAHVISTALTDGWGVELSPGSA